MTAAKSNHETDLTAQAKSNDVPELVVAPSGGAENEDVPERYQTREDLEKALNETKKSEAQLVESEARLRTIIDMVPSFLWTSLSDGSKEYLNKRWYDYTGLSLEEGQGGERAFGVMTGSIGGISFVSFPYSPEPEKPRHDAS